MASCGDRFRFRPHSGSYVPAQEVTVTRIIEGDRFWCSFKRKDEVDAEVMCSGLEVPGYGVLEPIEMPRAKQHDLITLEEWRQKARSADWPRGG